MLNNVKPSYVNPLTMMKSDKNRQVKPFYPDGIQTAKKRKGPTEQKVPQPRIYLLVGKKELRKKILGDKQIFYLLYSLARDYKGLRK